MDRGVVVGSTTGSCCLGVGAGVGAGVGFALALGGFLVLGVLAIGVCSIGSCLTTTGVSLMTSTWVVVGSIETFFCLRGARLGLV